MLKEEAHHMFVGATGVGRVVARTAELMLEHDTTDVSSYGGINLDTVQRYLNFHFSVSLDLFGGDVSTNAASYFTAGLKGRFHEEGRDDDHRLHDAITTVQEVQGDCVVNREVGALTALNVDLRDQYIADCAKGVSRWNRALAGTGHQLRLPHPGFNRMVGPFAGHFLSPEGRCLTPLQWERGAGEWLPNDEDRAHVAGVMRPVYEPGHVASWLTPPTSGINTKPVDFEYVKR
jgi:benzoyl-CoA 2,3-dioxygenase component B